MEIKSLTDEKRKSLTDEANKILINEIAPLITKMFASSTYDFFNQPFLLNLKGDVPPIKKIFDCICTNIKEFIIDYTEGTAELMYKELVKSNLKLNAERADGTISSYRD